MDAETIVLFAQAIRALKIRFNFMFAFSIQDFVVTFNGGAEYVDNKD